MTSSTADLFARRRERFFDRVKEGVAVLSILGRFRREARNPQRGPIVVNDVTDVIHELRLRKEPEEVALMERAAAIAAAAHEEARSAARPGGRFQDVHDRGRYHDAKEEWRLLEPGMVLTVEPGLYIRPDEKEVPASFLGIGVRIEDDVLVTAEGHRVLTAASRCSSEKPRSRQARASSASRLTVVGTVPRSSLVGAYGSKAMPGPSSRREKAA